MKVTLGSFKRSKSLIKGNTATMAQAEFSCVDDYIDSQPESVRDTLRVLRSTICKAIPQAQEVISYKMPTYMLDGDRVIYFASWKQHYSIYGATESVAAEFHNELALYQIDKGTIRFPISEPVPVELIEGLAKFRAQEVARRVKTKATRHSQSKQRKA